MEPYPLEDNQIPNQFISASPQMIEDFQKYGDFCSFDITYNLVKEFLVDERGKKKKWGLGIFLGKNNNNNAVPFAICLMNSET